MSYKRRKFSYPAPPPRPHCTFETPRVILRKKPILGRIYGFFRTEFGYYPLPPTLDSQYFARAKWFFPAATSELFGHYPKSQDFPQFRLGNPDTPNCEHSNLSIIHTHSCLSLRVVESTTVTHSSPGWWELLLPLWRRNQIEGTDGR